MLKYQGNQEKRCKSRSVNNVSCKVGVRRYTIWKDLKQKVEDQPQLCLYWCATRAVRCTRCTWGGRGPCRCWRTERGGCCCWRWWERSRSRTTRSARTPSSSVRTSASWRSPTSTQPWCCHHKPRSRDHMSHCKPIDRVQWRVTQVD